MNKLSRGKSTHSDKLERWLGAETVQRVSNEFKDFYYPVPLNGVPGKVFVMPGGDFAGEIQAGAYMSKHDSALETMRRVRQRADRHVKTSKAAMTMLDMVKADNAQMRSLSAFASVDAVIAAVTGGKGQQLLFQKVGVASNAVGNANDLWTRAGYPAAGAAGGASPGGTSPTSASTGALPFQNIGVANSGHYLSWTLTASVVNNSLLLYDRLFAVVKTMASTATQAITGVPTRYQNTSSTALDFIGGNFYFPANPTTVLAATAHNWTVCTYLDHTNAAGTSPSTAGVSACVVGGVDLAVGNWFMPLAAGDLGVKAITQLQCSASVATGTIDFVIGHPIAVNVCPVANIACMDDGLYTSMNLQSIQDNACLTFLELPKPATTATTYSGFVRTVSE